MISVSICWEKFFRKSKDENQGRLPKLFLRQKQNIIRQTKILREEMRNFFVKKTKFRAGIPRSVTDETFSRVLKKAGVKWRHAQKKGVLRKNELAQRVRRTLPKNFWTEWVEFYLDGPHFTHKTNQFDHARAPKAMDWKKTDQGFSFGFTAKGSQKILVELLPI